MRSQDLKANCRQLLVIDPSTSSFSSCFLTFHSCWRRQANQEIHNTIHTQTIEWSRALVGIVSYYRIRAAILRALFFLLIFFSFFFVIEKGATTVLHFVCPCSFCCGFFYYFASPLLLAFHTLSLSQLRRERRDGFLHVQMVRSSLAPPPSTRIAMIQRPARPWPAHANLGPAATDEGLTSVAGCLYDLCTTTGRTPPRRCT